LRAWVEPRPLPPRRLRLGRAPRAPARGDPRRRRVLRTGRTSAGTTPGYLDAVAADSARPSAPLVIGTFAQKTHGVRGTDQVATLDAPSWQPPPPVLGLTRGVRCNG
jgi:hypothetical protein